MRKASRMTLTTECRVTRTTFTDKQCERQDIYNTRMFPDMITGVDDLHLERKRFMFEYRYLVQRRWLDWSYYTGYAFVRVRFFWFWYQQQTWKILADACMEIVCDFLEGGNHLNTGLTDSERQELRAKWISEGRENTWDDL